MWQRILAAASLLDSLGVLVGLGLAAYFYHGEDMPKAIFWLLIAIWCGRGQSRER